MPDPLAMDAIERRRNPWVTAAAAAPFVATVALVAAAVVVNSAFATPILHLLIVGVVGTLYARKRNPWPRQIPVKLTVDSEALTVDDGVHVERIAKAGITRGVKLPTEHELRVRLSCKPGRDRELTLPGERQADELLEELGLDVTRSVASFRAMSRIHVSQLRLFATVFGTMGAGILLGVLSTMVIPGGSPVATLAGALALFLLMFLPTRVEVGGDGVVIRWLGRTRFIRHAEIADVEVQVLGSGKGRRNAVVLTLGSGEAVIIPTGSSSWDAGSSRMLAARIEDARRAAADGGVAPGALLRRGQRPHLTWIRALRARAVVDLRSPAVPEEQLWRVIEDAAAEPVDRAAAVVALGSELNERERGRLANAARVVAAPKLRVMLEDGPDADEDELAKMLGELEVVRRA